MKRALIGNGGHAREVMAQMSAQFICFVDDEYLSKETNQNIPLSKFDPSEYEVMVAVGDSTQRKKIVEKLPITTRFFTFIHPSALILSKEVKIGDGTFIGAYSILTCNISLGKHSLLNRSNHIGHDCQIRNFASLMPGSIISGNCQVGECFYLGTNSGLKEKLLITDYVKIGMNSCVINHIQDSGTYAGVPVKKINS